jgi:hypothetical protein
MDNINRKPPRRGGPNKGKKPLTNQQKDWFKDGAYLKYSKKGHYANNYQSRQVSLIKKETDDDTPKREVA